MKSRLPIEKSYKAKIVNLKLTSINFVLLNDINNKYFILFNFHLITNIV